MADIDINQIRRLDFTLLLILRSLLRHRRTTLTADELGLSQSAISHALARLRDLFGDALFTRRPHGLEPTRHALELAPHVEALIDQAAELLGLGDGFDPATATRGFRIGASEYLSTLLSPALLRAFEAGAPGARFAFRVTLGPDALERLSRGEIDIALGQFRSSLEGFETRRLFTDRYCLVARAGHPLIGARVSAAGFERLNHVAVSVGGDFRSFTDDSFRELGLSRRIVATAPTFTAAFAVAADTDAVAIAPERLARLYAGRLKLSVRELPRALPPIEVLAVRKAGRDRGAEWLIDLIARSAAVDAGRPDAQPSPPS